MLLNNICIFIFCKIRIYYIIIFKRIILTSIVTIRLPNIDVIAPTIILSMNFSINIINILFFKPINYLIFKD